MKGSVTSACLLAVSVVLVGSSAFAQREGASTKASPTIKTLMLENDKKLGDMELMLNKLDAAEVVLEADIKNLEKALLGYVEGMDNALAAARDTAKKEVMAKEQKVFDDMAEAFETRLRRIDTLHTAIADKIQSAIIQLDKAWLNKRPKRKGMVITGL
jgi:hypothetical protein